MEREEKMELPRFVALKSIHNNKYMRYVEEAGGAHGCFRFSEKVVSSPYAKLEVEMAKTSNNGKQLVHIKCCFNNKYLVRWTPNHWWIVAQADEPEEDQSKWSCTLFEVLFLDGPIHPSIENDNKKIRLRHVQLGHYACLWRVTAPFNSCLHAGSENFDEDWCDIFTFIDCESVLSTLTSSMLAREEMALLSGTVVFKSNHNHKYLRYIYEYGLEHRFLRFSGEEVCSQYAKFELRRAMTSSGKGCVHIRCCYNNKYFVRKSANDPWIVAGADEPEEDRSKWSCTLFEPFYVDDDNDDAQTVRFRYVQLGCYACLWREATSRDLCLCAGSPEPDKDQCDVYTIIDWESLLILPPKDEAFTIQNMTLPTFAVLKSNNDRCLHYIHEDVEVHGFLQFSGEEVSSQYSKYELEMANTSSNGNVLVHIKCCYNNKYFVRWLPNHWWIVASADEPEEDQSKWSCTLFEPRRVCDCDAAQTTIGSVAQAIRLRHVQLGHYACSWTTTGISSCLYLATIHPDKEQDDVFTIINWELLSLLQPKSNAFTRETVALPRFVVIKSNYNGKYLRYIHEDGAEHEFVQFSGEEFVSPYTKYEVVMAKTSGGRGPFVHLRCCYNNKYLVKWSSKHRWIVARADEPEEDQKQWSCTLLEPLYENVVAQTIRFRHVRVGCYVCLWRIDSPHDFCLFTGNSMLDPDRRDLYTIIDWESLFILPKCVAFKGKNGKYLSPCSIKGHQYLHFSSSSDITDPMVCNENWILADSDDSTTSSDNNNNNSSSVLTRIFLRRSEKKRNQKQKQENNSPESDMLFWPTKVGNNVVALRNLGNGKLCKIFSSANGKINCLSADVSTISTEVHLEVDETVTSRKIYNVNFRLRDARIYNRSILTLATEDAINRTQEPKIRDVKLSYSESRRAWNTGVSLKLLGVKTTIQTTAPLIIAEGKIELS
ncbi:hypothetical protein LOK49_LG03G00187 [Camellia lanceoleosa]|uniref:Uncharacterized protein n=1 Tax=Camellia lanceoleosa TaxID=1840588 RepID=A0ACC0IEU6_9ERIC|nr:hypothetical protein LOK49_LG03G00187 [Camellia lanceoleosa]